MHSRESMLPLSCYNNNRKHLQAQVLSTVLSKSRSPDPAAGPAIDSRLPAAAPPHPLHMCASAHAAQAHAQVLGAASAWSKVEAACNVLRVALAMQERLGVSSRLRTLAC